MIYTPEQLLAAIPHNKRCQAAIDAGHLPWPLCGTDSPPVQKDEDRWERAVMCPRCGRRAVVASTTPHGDEVLVVGKGVTS